MNPVTTPVTWTDRQARERAFYQEFARQHGQEPVDFAPIATSERRPWNPYWYVYHTIQAFFVGPHQRLLDVGCGAGKASIVYARMGYQVTGCDICEAHVGLCEERAREYGYEERTSFSVQAAERLPWNDETFDVVAGIDILHHVEVLPVMEQAYRVLRPGGLAVFREFVEVPTFERFRSSRLMRWIFPQESSIAAHRTEDERKLTCEEVAAIGRRFSQVHEERFCLLSRVYRVVRRRHPERACRLERWDAWAFRTWPWLRPYGGELVLVMKK